MRPTLGEREVTKGRGVELLFAVGGRLVVLGASGDGVGELWVEGQRTGANRVVGCRFGPGNLVAPA